MELRHRNLLLGGAVVLGGALCAWYLYGKKSQPPVPAKEAEPISKDLMILILKEQIRESYPLLKFTSQIFKLAFQEQKRMNQEIPMNETWAYVFSQYSIREKLDAISENIRKKNGVSDKEWTTASDVTYKDDQDIQELRKILEDSLLKACCGISPKLASTLPDFLTAEKTLQMHEKFLRKEEKIIRKLLEPLEKEDRSFWEDQERVSLFKSSANIALEVNAEKREVLVAEELGGFEDAPEKIYDTALFWYRLTPGFKQKVRDLELGRVNFMEEFEKGRLQCTS